MMANGMGFDLNYLGAHLFGGGLMLGAWFMATDYVTTPITPKGQLAYGCCLGILTAIFRLFGGSAEGVSYAIIFCNLLVPLIEKVTRPTRLAKEGKNMKSNTIVKDTLALTLITLVAGLLLGLVHDITAALSRQNRREQKQRHTRRFLR